MKARQLAESGRYQDLLGYLRSQEGDALERSPTLALLYASAQARLGQDAEARSWVNLALTRAGEQGDRPVEARALNLQGAIALEAGRLDEASRGFMRGLDVAKQADDSSTVGRCSNNLGIIADQQGEYGRALSWYRLALAAYQQAGLDRGITETHHNLAMTHLAEGDYDRALEEADHAVEAADRLGDRALYALALSGRAEIRVLAGDEAFGRREVERALNVHRELGDVVGEAQDLRILSMAMAESGEVGEAENLLRDVIGRAESLGRPHLAATAGRELAGVLQRLGQSEEARQVARTARQHFEQLGALAEARKLDELAG